MPNPNINIWWVYIRVVLFLAWGLSRFHAPANFAAFHRPSTVDKLLMAAYRENLRPWLNAFIARRKPICTTMAYRSASNVPKSMMLPSHRRRLLMILPTGQTRTRAFLVETILRR